MKKKPSKSVVKKFTTLDPVVAEFGLTLTLPQAATLTNLPVRRIRDLIAGGKISFQRQGKKHLVKREDLIAYLGSQWTRNTA